MDNETALKLSIEHWERMIKWAEQQPKKDYVNIYHMTRDMSETWSAEFCELCIKYSNYYEKGETSVFSCGDCLLRRKYGECSPLDFKEKNENYWKIVSHSETWGKWVDNAKIFLNQLKGLNDD